MLDQILINLLEKPDKFIKENEEGNIEYKLRLDLKDELHLKKLTSQLLWRLNEGLNLSSKEIAIYIIGVYDNGKLGGLSKDVIDDSVNILKNILNKINASIHEEKYLVINNSNIYIGLIKINPKKLKITELNVMLCGDTNNGKSSIIANLCNDILDSGNGTIRNYILKHPHEKISGRTTTISKEIIGIRNDSILNYTYSNNWAELLELSNYVISLYDTPGDLKYIPNIIYGILSYQIDMLLIIDIYTIHNKLSPFTIFLKTLCESINIPYKIILNKCDLIANYQFNKDSELVISIKDGTNIDKLKDFLINLQKHKQPLSYINNYYRVTDTYNIPHIGKILTGIQIMGDLYQNMNVKIISNTNVYESKIVSIYKKYIPTDIIYKDESGSINLLLNEMIRIEKTSIIIPSKDYELIKYYNMILVTIINPLNILSDNIKYLFFNGNNITECILKNSILLFSKNILLQNNIFVLIPYNLQANILDYILFGNIKEKIIKIE
jgi:GTPase